MGARPRPCPRAAQGPLSASTPVTHEPRQPRPARPRIGQIVSAAWQPDPMTTTVALLIGLLLGLVLGAGLTVFASGPLFRARQSGLAAERDLLRERITDLEVASGQGHGLVDTL